MNLYTPPRDDTNENCPHCGRSLGADKVYYNDKIIHISCREELETLEPRMAEHKIISMDDEALDYRIDKIERGKVKRHRLERFNIRRRFAFVSGEFIEQLTEESMKLEEAHTMNGNNEGLEKVRALRARIDALRQELFETEKAWTEALNDLPPVIVEVTKKAKFADVKASCSKCGKPTNHRDNRGIAIHFGICPADLKVEIKTERDNAINRAAFKVFDIEDDD